MPDESKGGRSPPRRGRSARVSDWVCTAAAFAVVLGVVFGTGPAKHAVASDAERTAMLLPAQGEP